LLGNGNESLALILLNFRRPQNIGPIVRSVIDALPDVNVFILDQADNNDLRLRNDVPWGQVWYRKAAFNGRAGARIRLASQLPFRYFLALDDDIFPDASHLKGLFEALRCEPTRAHGLWGRIILRADDKHYDLSDGRSYDGPVSVVHMAYAFDKAHVERTMALAAEMGFPSWEHVRFGDDLLLSCAGLQPPLCHHFGPLQVCSTSLTKGIAVQAEANFDDVRLLMYKWLLSRQRIMTQPAGAKE
jgi:hypothetical protein